MADPRRMRLVPIALLASLLPAVALANPLAGVWKSDRDLTLQRLEREEIPAAHKKIIVEEGDLGNAVVEFRAKEYTWTLGDQQRTLPYKILAVNGNTVEIEYYQHAGQTKPRRARMFVTPTLIYMPVPEFSFYEIFRRVEPAPAAPR